MNIFTLLFSFVLTYSLGLCSGQKPQTGNIVTASDLKEWVSYLASDEMLGRKNGSPEMRSAALWIAGRFSEYGLKNLSEKDSYFQDYSYTSRQKTIAEQNVIGIIEGSDPVLRDQYIVISAHFDHIGTRRGNLQDSICNGADDNASGTCALIGIAKYIKLSGFKPGRSIILAAFSGEESGMRGSRYFVSSPPVPLKNIIADINFEMIGHSELLGKKNYYMTGCVNSNLDDLIGEFNRGTDFSLVDTIAIANQLFFQSDNISFSRISMADGKIIGIPSGTFATSTMASYLHTVDDEYDLLDIENMADLVNYFGNMILWLSNTSSEIKWADQRFSRP
jgi:Zn-dependent M28 family amino/carboxypeptidase